MTTKAADNCKSIRMVSGDNVGFWTLRKEEGLVRRVDGIQLALTQFYPCMDECKPRLSSIYVVNKDNLVVTDPHDKHCGVANKKLVQLESLLSTEALVRFKDLKDNDPSVPLSRVVKTAS